MFKLFMKFEFGRLKRFLSLEEVKIGHDKSLKFSASFGETTEFTATPGGTTVNNFKNRNARDKTTLSCHAFTVLNQRDTVPTLPDPKRHESVPLPSISLTLTVLKFAPEALQLCLTPVKIGVVSLLSL